MENYRDPPILVYAKQEAGRVAQLDSSIFLTNLEGWTEIDNSGSATRPDRQMYAHAQGSYLPYGDLPGLFDEEGLHNYKLEGSTLVLCDEQDKAQERESLPPVPKSPLEELQEDNKLLRAQMEALSGQMDFYGDCLAEMAMQVYGEVQ